MLVLPDVTESFFVGRYPLLRREGNYHWSSLETSKPLCYLLTQRSH